MKKKKGLMEGEGGGRVKVAFGDGGSVEDLGFYSGFVVTIEGCRRRVWLKGVSHGDREESLSELRVER